MPALIAPIFSFLFGWIKSALPVLAGFFGASVVQLPDDFCTSFELSDLLAPGSPVRR